MARGFNLGVWIEVVDRFSPSSPSYLRVPELVPSPGSIEGSFFAVTSAWVDCRRPRLRLESKKALATPKLGPSCSLGGSKSSRSPSPVTRGKLVAGRSRRLGVLPPGPNVHRGPEELRRPRLPTVTWPDGPECPPPFNGVSDGALRGALAFWAPSKPTEPAD